MKIVLENFHEAENSNKFLFSLRKLYIISTKLGNFFVGNFCFLYTQNRAAPHFLRLLMSLIYFVIYLQKEVLKHVICEGTDFDSAVKKINIKFF